jgi:resolvase-like protein
MLDTSRALAARRTWLPTFVAAVALAAVVAQATVAAGWLAVLWGAVAVASVAVRAQRGGVALHRRPEAQALAVVLVFALDGAIAQAVGAPPWVGVGYAAIGLAAAAVRLRLVGPAAAPAVIPEPAPAGRAQDRPLRRPDRARLAIGYLRAASEAGDSAVQGEAAAIAAWCAANSFELTHVLRDAAADSPERPGLEAALANLRAGEAYVLVAARLSDLCDTSAALRSLILRVRAVGGALVAMDARLDTSSDAGRIAAAAFGTIAGGPA